MKLGIHVNSDKHLEHVIGLTKAAVSKGPEVVIFTMSALTLILTKEG